DDYITRPTQESFVENALVHAMVTCLTEHVPAPDTFGSRCHSTVMARFTRLLEAEPKKLLYLAEICAATGVSERPLRLCCHEHQGTGPVRYLWLRRMHLARAALMRGDPQTTSMTAVAVNTF